MHRSRFNSFFILRVDHRDARQLADFLGVYVQAGCADTQGFLGELKAYETKEGYWKQRLANVSDACLVETLDSRKVGFAVWSSDARGGELDSVWVAPSFRGQGAGLAMQCYVFDALRAERLSDVFVTVHNDNTIQAGILRSVFGFSVHRPSSQFSVYCADLNRMPSVKVFNRNGVTKTAHSVPCLKMDI